MKNSLGVHCQMPKSAIADDQRVIKLPKRKEVTWYENDYGFGPTFVLYVGKVAPIFIAILDWHAAVKHFQPSAFSSGGKCKDENAREFVTLFTRVKKQVMNTYELSQRRQCTEGAQEVLEG
jgi:hypothetical protein